MDKSEPYIVPLTWHTSAVSHVTGIKIELLDRTLEIPLLQRHPVVFGQNLFFLESAESHFTLFVKYS